MLQIDQEFKEACPELSSGELSLLRESIIKYGVREPILHWKGLIVDGHNRYAICKELNIAYPHKAMNFSDRTEAIGWIIRNQLARRNLTREQIRYLWGKHFKNLAEPNFDSGGKAASVRSISKASGVSRSEVSRAIEFSKEVDEMAPEERAATLSGASKKKPGRKKKEGTTPKTRKRTPKDSEVTAASEGRVPVSLTSVANSKVLPTCLEVLDSIVETITKVVNEDTGAWIASAPLMDCLSRARGIVAAALFYDVCPECNGRKGGCDECRRTGWVPKFRYDELCGITGAQKVSGRRRKQAPE